MRSRYILVSLVLALLPAAEGFASPSTVDQWLEAHPSVAQRMIWEFPKARRVVLSNPKPIELPGPIGGDPAPLAGGKRAAPRMVSRAANGGGSNSAGGVGSQRPPIVGALDCAAAATNEDGARVLSWPCWPAAARAELRSRVAAYRSWAATACPLYRQFADSDFGVEPAGFADLFSSVVDLDPAPVADPPVNLQPDSPGTDTAPWMVVPSAEAFALYVRQVAAQLALELEDGLSWSIAEQAPGDLSTLFDGREIFQFVEPGPSPWGTMNATGHVLTVSVIPAPPLVVLGFLAENGLLGDDRTTTVLRTLQWERLNLRHVVGGQTTPPSPSGVVYWGYNGRAPASRMIRGTVMAAPLLQSNGSTFFDDDVRHWTGGCGGTASFTEAVLRIVGIAAHRASYAHFQNSFALDGGSRAWTGHADDPYGILAAPEIPIDEILIDDATFHSWFIDEPDPAKRQRAVSRRTADLYLEYLPLVLVKRHCQDQAQGNSHASSKVYDFAFSSSYTVAEMEGKGLWTGLDAKLATLGGCEVVGLW